MGITSGSFVGGAFGYLSEELQDRNIRPSDSVRINGKRQQYLLTDGQVYVVDETNDTMYLALAQNGNMTTPTDAVALVIPQGTYATPAALRTAATTALQSLFTDATALTVGGSLLSGFISTIDPLACGVYVLSSTGVDYTYLYVSEPDGTYAVVPSGNLSFLTDAQNRVSSACMQLFGFNEWAPLNYGNSDIRFYIPPFFCAVYAQEPMMDVNTAVWKISSLTARVNMHGKRPFNKVRDNAP
jgi:hypothetical protein